MAGLRIMDLFSGAGGLAEGFRQAGFQVKAGSDVDPDACASFATNFPEARTIHGDIRSPKIKRNILALACEADVIIGGPPCQAFSQVRNHSRLIDDPRNSLYREFVTIVRRASPMAFVMENVPGLQQMGAKNQVLEDLALRGQYRVSAQLLDAGDFGVPQTRRRLVFIGIHRSLDQEPPVLTGTGATGSLVLARHNGRGPLRYEPSALSRLVGAGPLLRCLQDPEDARLVSASQAVGDLFALPAGFRQDELSESTLPAPMSAYQRMMRSELPGIITNVSVPRINEDTVLRLSGIPQGGNHRDLSSTLRARYLTGQRWGPHNGTGQLGRRHYYAYRRLHPDFWSWTLNTKADSVYHYLYPRALSVREFARLQSFPDRFRFETDPRRGVLPGRIDGGAAHSRYRQVGNAVPPLLARAVATAVQAVVQREARPMLAV